MTKLEESGFARRARGFSRRDLVRAIGLSAGGMALGLTSLGGGSKALAAVAPPGTPTQLLLELDGSVMPVYAAEGGNAFAEVVLDPNNGAFTRKRTATLKYEDLILDVRLPISKALSDWLNQTLTTDYAPKKNGTLVASAMHGVEVRRLEFFNGVINEVTLAPLDASEVQKDLFRLTLRISAETTRLVGPQAAAASLNTSGPKAKAPTAFRFSIDGLEKATANTRKISALAANRGSGRFDCAPVTITVPEADAAALYGWFDETVLKGKSGPSAERAGRVEMLAPDMRSVVATVELGNLGIVRYAPLFVSTGMGGVVEVDMYCETLRFKFN